MPNNNKILLVEDDKFLAKMYSTKLTNAGYNLLVANDGEQAYKIILRQKPVLILLDILLPVINGFDILEAIRANNELVNTKVIIMSNLAQDEDKQKAKDLGVVDYIVKANAQPKEVITIIEKHLS